MKRKKKGIPLMLGIFISIIIAFFVLIALNNKMSVEQVLNEVFSGNDANLVYLSSPDCSWCQKQKPILKKVEKKYNFKHYYINVGALKDDELKSLLNKFEIDISEFGTPTFVVVRNKDIENVNIGYLAEEDLVDFLDKSGVINK